MNRITFLVVLCFFAITGHSQIYINEFMAANSSTIKDPDFGDDADWIELYNAGNTAVNLDGYYLTDNISNPNKWRISNISIAAKGYVIFWADGLDTLSNHTNFKLSSDMEEIGLFNPALTVVDSLSYGLQSTDISMGRYINDIDVWGHYNVPTPNAANTSEFFSDVVLNEPMYNIKGGIYNSNQSITLYTDLGGVIRYTLDGSQPTTASTLYSSPIQLSSTTVVRARVFNDNMLPGPVITNTYFINDGMESRGLPAVSISSEPANFWDASTGIYAQSFKPDWEIPVNIELFENNGADRAAFNEKAGIKINGLYSWYLPEKMLGVYFRKKYGNNSLDYSVFYNTNRTSFETFALRASGNDWSNSLMRDILGQQMTKLNMSLDLSAWRWTTVYINGAYMGIHNFREKIESNYIEEHYGMDAGTFDMIENETYAECGDLTQYNELTTLFSKDLSNSSNYNAVAEKLDIENFTDLVITEVESGNGSIDHNVMAWKPKDSGKWKWILMDLDRGFYTSTSNTTSFSVSQTSFPFSNLMANSNYKAYYGKRLADHLYTSFNPALMCQYIDDHYKALLPEINRHVARWLGTTSAYGNAMASVAYWQNQVGLLKSFAYERPMVLINELANYGYTSGTAQLTVSAYPENAGSLKLNDFKLGVNSTSALYLKGVSSQFTATAKAGYSFKGWSIATKNLLIPKLSTWKYFDSGTNLGTSWYNETFDDSAWKSGNGEFGYGEGDEATTVSYGTSASNKHITTYFRKSFTATASDLNACDYWIHIKRDDGAIVYINGVEVIRDNMTLGDITYTTTATFSTSSVNEAAYFSYHIDKSILKVGSNTVAVEVHQNDATSSDLSFDLQLSYYKATDAIVSTNATYPFNLSGDLSLVAVFESSSECVVPEEISSNMTLYKACSPYIVRGDVNIKSGVTLNIEPGVVVLMSPESNFYINGNIIAEGTATDSITFKINPTYAGQAWGALNFWNCTATTSLKHCYVANGSRGPIPQRVGVISAYNSDMNIDYLRIDNTTMNPMASRYSDIVLTNSYIHSNYTSDLLNIKYGHARIENCIFDGNPEYDSDAIDYDGIENGIIRNTKILNTLGSNGDAIDIGEETHNVIIDSVVIINAYDKGVSIGQRSSVTMTNSLLMNCNMGVGVKDSSSISINHCTFYGNGYAISCYEKNAGRAGGNAKVYNSILSNVYETTYLSDSKSTILFNNCLSDNAELVNSTASVYDNPMFENPTFYKFGLKSNSPIIAKRMGSTYSTINMEPEAVICNVFLNVLSGSHPEYIAIRNPSTKAMDVSGYNFDKGVTALVPDGTIIEAGDTLIFTADASVWSGNKKVIQWIEGHLSNNGESIRLLNGYGLVADYIDYSPLTGWPAEAFTTDTSMSLISTDLDNHFAYNWLAKPIINGISSNINSNATQLYVYPNPAKDYIWVQGDFELGAVIRIYNNMGQLTANYTAKLGGRTKLDLSSINQGIYIVKVGNQSARILKQ